MELFSKLKKMSILLVDDDEWIRHSLTLFFENESCRLTALETAEEAVAALEKKSYDIIIADYRLPGMDGLQFFRKIKDSNGKARKVMITAYGNEDLVSESEVLGVEAFIEKPFTSKTIEDVLSGLLLSHIYGK